MKRTIFTFCMMLVIISLIMVGCSSRESERETIKIGVLVPLTGPVAEYGANTRLGAELAAEEINARGGINGQMLELSFQDSMCSAKEAMNGFNQLVESEGVSMIMGTICSSETLAISPLANEKKILVISPGASSPEIRNAGDYIFRVYPSDDYEATAAADFIFNKLKKSNVAIFYLNNDYGMALKDVFTSKFTAFGGEVLIVESYLQDATDLRTQLIKIKEKKPDVIYMISYPKDGGLGIKQAKELGINALFFGTSGLKANDFISTGGPATEGFLIAAASEESSDKREIFAQNYLNRFGLKPGLTSDRAYDAIYLLAESFAKVKTIDDIKNELYKIKDYDGVTGLISFDSYGDLTDIKYNLFVIDNASFVDYEDKQ